MLRLGYNNTIYIVVPIRPNLFISVDYTHTLRNYTHTLRDDGYDGIYFLPNATYYLMKWQTINSCEVKYYGRNNNY